MTNPSGGTSSKDMTISGTATAAIVNGCGPAPPRNTRLFLTEEEREGERERHWEKGAPPSSCRKSTNKLVSAPTQSLGGSWGRGQGLMVADTDVA